MSTDLNGEYVAMFTNVGVDECVLPCSQIKRAREEDNDVEGW